MWAVMYQGGCARRRGRSCSTLVVRAEGVAVTLAGVVLARADVGGGGGLDRSRELD